ncbi:MAG: hypothetical protein KZQ65_05675 [Candidatus Thiodiazotropha sp. (ex Gloverina cf. vestifex)]|nr:hypothetical protein [Candidatus Thiodiazotropha sp. (ex Gloverina cf. vestifex)]
MLMSGRYNMMSGLYRYLFDEPCDDVSGIGLDRCYHINDRRIEKALIEARQSVADETVADAADYKASCSVPFVFSD